MKAPSFVAIRKLYENHRHIFASESEASEVLHYIVRKRLLEPTPDEKEGQKQ